jgi:hypothetical protein
LVVQLQPYGGKLGNVREVGLGKRVVLDLLESKHLGPPFSLLADGRRVYIDNYFNSPELCIGLSEERVKVIGTCRANRKNYPKLEDVKKEQGSWTSKKIGNLVAVAWCDKKRVNFLTNDENLLSETTVKRRQKDGERKAIPCPEVVHDYGAHMGGVDAHNHLRHSYSIARITHKWWMSVYYFLIDTAITNTYIRHNLRLGTEYHITHLRFMELLALGLISNWTGRLKRGNSQKKK